ncbi:MAG: outer membrane protein assembly factor BamD [Candidatus Eisenbacteria bacterium]
MSSRLRAACAALVAAGLLAGCGAAVVPSIHSDSNRVAIARGLYERREYALAVDVLSAYATTGTGNADIDQAVYLLGLSYLGQKEWASAQTQFERMARDYPESDSASSAAFQLGEALYGQSRPSDFDQEFTLKALQQYENYRRDFADGAYGPRADRRIAELRTRLARKLWRNGDVYVKQKLYLPAKRYFADVIEQYADTPILGDAILSNAVADARLGKRDSALVVLRGLEQQFAGQPLGIKAQALRLKMEKWPAEGDRARRGHRPIEAPAPAPGTPSNAQGTSYTP